MIWHSTAHHSTAHCRFLPSQWIAVLGYFSAAVDSLTNPSRPWERRCLVHRLAPAVQSAMLETWSDEAVAAAVVAAEEAQAKGKKRPGHGLVNTPPPGTPDTDMLLSHGSPAVTSTGKQSQDRGSELLASKLGGRSRSRSQSPKTSEVRNFLPPLSASTSQRNGLEPAMSA